MEKQKYMNPITFEAELFVNNMENLSKIYNNVDAVLVSSLEKVMNAIEKFLDSNPTEIVAAGNTELVKCGDIGFIKRIYYCTFCKQDLGKSAEKVTLHLIRNCTNRGRLASSKEQELQKLRNELRMEACPKKQKACHNQNSKLTKKARCWLKSDLTQFISDQSKISEKLTCLPEYDQIETELRSLITPLFPDENIKIYKFGSRISGIGNRESDLDLYIDIGTTFSVLQNRVDADTLIKLHKVCNALKNDKKSWKGLVKIDKARVPILKVMHASTGIECDINFSNSMGTVNTKLFEFLFHLQPIAQLLCIFLKKWLNRTGFNDDINTYSINLMALFYLQTVKVLPSMERLQENVNLEKTLCVGPWLCTYSTLTLNELQIPLESVNDLNLFKFVRGFFVFYTNLKFNKKIICPYLGKVVKKKDLENLMPARYVEFAKKTPEFSLQLDKPIIVQDPIQLNHNTTKNLSESTLNTLKSFMAYSLEILNDIEASTELNESCFKPSN